MSSHDQETRIRTVVITYTNHRGETTARRIRPLGMYFGTTEWHPEEQWLLEAWDLDKRDTRTFAMDHIHQWSREK
jgi:predicted DNA-binding transcriptional regulator YafY